MIVSSFAMHLIDETRLLSTCNQMSFVADYLVIISPHKKPEINERMGWTLKYVKASFFFFFFKKD